MKRGGKRQVGVQKRKKKEEREKKKRRFLWKVGVRERAGDSGSIGDCEGCQKMTKESRKLGEVVRGLER